MSKDGVFHGFLLATTCDDIGKRLLTFDSSGTDGKSEGRHFQRLVSGRKSLERFLLRTGILTPAQL